MEADIVIARIGAVDRQPVHEIGIGRTAHPLQHDFPRRQHVDPPAERSARAFDAGPALSVEPVRGVHQQGFKPHAEPDQRQADFGEGHCRLLCQFHEVPVELRCLRLDPVAGFLPAFVAGIGDRAHGSEQLLQRTGRLAIGEALQPALRGQGLGSLAGGGNRLAARLVITGHVRQPRREAPAAPL